jgi:NADH-quinone oxidoreductase subunit E
MAKEAPVETLEPDLSGIDELLDSFLLEPGTPQKSILIPVLQAVQARCGYLPPEALRCVAAHFNIPLSSIYGVVTFYAQFYLEPRGRHTVRVCRGTACHVRGASNILSTIEQVLGVSDGETTPDLEFTIETVACLGTCFLAPVMMIDENYYGKLNSGKVRKVFEEFSGRGEPRSRKSPGRKRKSKSAKKN